MDVSFPACDSFEAQLDEMIRGKVDFSSVGEDGNFVGFFTQSHNGTPLAWTPQSSPTLTPCESPPQNAWEFDLSGTFLKKVDSDFYTSTPAAAQGLTKNVMPLDEAASRFTASPQTVMHKPAPVHRVSVPVAIPAAKNRMLLSSFQLGLRQAHRHQRHIQSIVSQQGLNKMDWTLEQFNAALRLF